MARAFNGVSGANITVASGAVPDTTQFTWAVVYRQATFGLSQLLFGFTAFGNCGMRISTTPTLQAVIEGTTFASTPPINPGPTDGWAMFAVTKAAGASSPRFHYYVYATDTWTRASATTAVTGTTTARTSVRIGSAASGSNTLNGDIAAVAAYSVALTDEQVGSLPSSLSTWAALGPTAMWVLDQADVSQPVIDWTGGGANQSAITGTAVSANSVPILSYGHPVLSTTPGGAGGGGPETGTAALTVGGTQVSAAAAAAAAGSATLGLAGMQAAATGTATATAAAALATPGVQAVGASTATATGGAALTLAGVASVATGTTATTTGAGGLTLGATQAAAQGLAQGLAASESAIPSITAAAAGYATTTGAAALVLQSAIVAATDRAVSYTVSRPNIGAVTRPNQGVVIRPRTPSS